MNNSDINTYEKIIRRLKKNMYEILAFLATKVKFRMIYFVIKDTRQTEVIFLLRQICLDTVIDVLK